MKEFFDCKRFCQVMCLTTALYMACPARAPEPHVPEWLVPVHRTQMADWPSPVIPASGHFPGNSMY